LIVHTFVFVHNHNLLISLPGKNIFLEAIVELFYH